MPAGNSQSIEAVEAPHKQESEQSEWRDFSPRSAMLRSRAEAEVGRIFAMVDQAAGRSEYQPFEQQLIPAVFRLGRLFITLFLALWQERRTPATREVHGKETYRRQPPKPRLLGTFFGKVRYWRNYLEQTNGKRRGGFYPVDMALGLTADGFSLGVLGRAVQLATKMSYATAVVLFRSFLRWSPSHTTIEKATLGLGRFTAEWVRRRPPPEDDGDLLVIQVDGKATPTIRDEELAKRRGKRASEAERYPDSPRHRGRLRRARRAPKTRRKKGDKSKNGRMATLVVMYTLRRTTDANGCLMFKGPINRWVYASYAPKRHAFAVARREADKRGFNRFSHRRIQVVTDGDEDLARLTNEFFPRATHTLDVIHAIEYLWKASTCLHREGSAAQRRWVEEQKDLLYDGQATKIIAALRAGQPRASSKAKRDRLAEIANYFDKRTEMMDYACLDRQDLELSTGIVEGAVRFVISQRFDEGGMRWIRERAEALLQLRCIEINGDWARFLAFVHATLSESQRRSRRQERLLQRAPEPLPTYGIDS
jgi:hypothetical protein